MKGRLENQLKIENRIKNLLKSMPDYVSEFYYSLATATTAKTAEEYIKTVKRFLENDDGTYKDIKKVTSNDINLYITEKRTKLNINNEICQTSHSYRKTIYAVLKKFFDFLYKTGKIKDNPMNVVEKPKGKDEVKRVRIETQDIKDLMQVVDNGGLFAVLATAFSFSSELAIILLKAVSFSIVSSIASLYFFANFVLSGLYIGCFCDLKNPPISLKNPVGAAHSVLLVSGLICVLNIVLNI